MATQDELKQVISRALIDPEFKAELVKNPADTVKKMGFDLTQEQAQMIKQVDMSGMASQVEEMVSKGSPWKI